MASLSQARRHKRKFDAVLTLEDPHARAPLRLRFTRKPQPEHLVLAFEDADSDRFGYATATAEQVRKAIAFGRDNRSRSLLVHCLHGVGRSTGCALAILADRFGPGREEAAVAALLLARPSAVPNLVVVGHADALLQRDGTLVAALHQAESQRPDKLATRAQRETFAQEHPWLYARRSRPSHGPGTGDVWSCDPHLVKPWTYAERNGLRSTLAAVFGWERAPGDESAGASVQQPRA